MDNAYWIEAIARVLAKEWYRSPLTTPDTIVSLLATELSNYGELAPELEKAYREAKDWERLPTVRT